MVVYGKAVWIHYKFDSFLLLSEHPSLKMVDFCFSQKHKVWLHLGGTMTVEDELMNQTESMNSKPVKRYEQECSVYLYGILCHSRSRTILFSSGQFFRSLSCFCDSS